MDHNYLETSTRCNPDITGNESLTINGDLKGGITTNKNTTITNVLLHNRRLTKTYLFTLGLVEKKDFLSQYEGMLSMCVQTFPEFIAQSLKRV